MIRTAWQDALDRTGKFFYETVVKQIETRLVVERVLHIPLPAESINVPMLLDAVARLADIDLPHTSSMRLKCFVKGRRLIVDDSHRTERVVPRRTHQKNIQLNIKYLDEVAGRNVTATLFDNRQRQDVNTREEERIYYESIGIFI